MGPSWVFCHFPLINMLQDFLRELARQTFPVTVKDPYKVQLVRALREAGHVLALTFKLDKRNDYVRVLTITPLGRHELAKSAVAIMNAGGDPLLT